MNSLRKTNLAGALLLLLILAITVVAAQEKPKTKQAEILSAVEFSRVVLFALQAVENNYSVRERLLPNVHVDDYYLVVLRTAKRLALQDAKQQPKQINPVVKVIPKKAEKRAEKKQEMK